ncbi:MAG: 50S ribosomal protein L28 [Bryobacterales bacterium]|nr:50S ribosomal protein L28 [Bryobacterales bacterium]
MAKVCAVTGKKPMSGNTVSHANNRSKRRFEPNLHTKRIWAPGENRFVTLKVSSRGLRTINKVGIDKVLAGLRKKGRNQ